MILQSLLLSAALLGAGQTEISEQQINTLLDHKGKVERQVQMPGLFSAHLRLTKGEVELGRQQTGMARVHGYGNATISMGNKPPVDARLQVTFEGKPRYDVASKSLYLDDANLIDYQIAPQQAQQQYGLMINMALQSLKQRLINQPIYTLKDDQRHRWWRDNLTGIEVVPGKLRLLTKQGSVGELAARSHQG